MLQPRTKSTGNANRRVRIGAHVSPQLREWLHRCTRAHSVLCHVVRCYGEPARAGGESNAGNEFVERAARGCRTLLYDAVGVAQDELEAVRQEIQHVMDTEPGPTHHPPGSGLKVIELAKRYHDGNSLHVAGDAQTDIR